MQATAVTTSERRASAPKSRFLSPTEQGHIRDIIREEMCLFMELTGRTSKSGADTANLFRKPGIFGEDTQILTLTLQCSRLELVTNTTTQHGPWNCASSTASSLLPRAAIEKLNSAKKSVSLVYSILASDSAGICPIVRIGTVAALREEPVLSRDGHPMDVYLVESQSIGGLSGSPVFIDVRTAQTTRPPR
jgi:hypothetical protein